MQRISRKRANVGVVAEQHCPHCGTPVNAAMEASGETVHAIPGDVTVCSNCGNFLMFDDSLTARVILPGIWGQLDDEYKAELFKVQARVRGADTV